MPWISVYDTVDGPKLRDLYKSLGCSKFEAIGILNFLWFWGLTNANKEGRILSADKEDISRYFYGVGAGSKLDTGKVVESLVETGWIDQTSEGLYIHDWEIWQDQWYKAIERREADAKRKRESRQKSAQPLRDADISDKMPTAAADSPHDSPPDKRADTEKYAKGFEEFWAVYPRRVGKGEAYKKYQARKKDGYSEEELLLAAKNYAASCKKNRTEQQYIKHAKTFLSDSLPFLDYLPKNNSAQTPETERQIGNPFEEYGDTT